MIHDPAIVIFDGECAFCDHSVKWIIAHDRAARFRFAPRQSAAGQALLAQNGLPPGGVESMILLEDDRVSTHSTAVLRIARHLRFPWKLAAAGLIVPRILRDFVYRAIAKRRYKLAGKRATCSVPTPEQQSRIFCDLPARPTH